MLQRLRVLQDAANTARPTRLLPSLWLSGAVEAHSLHVLRHLGITHVLNATEDLLLPEPEAAFECAPSPAPLDSAFIRRKACAASLRVLYQMGPTSILGVINAVRPAAAHAVTHGALANGAVMHAEAPQSQGSATPLSSSGYTGQGAPARGCRAGACGSPSATWRARTSGAGSMRRRPS